LSFDQPEIVERLEGNTVDDTGIADQRNDFTVFLLLGMPQSHTDCGCDSGAGMADGELVIFAFFRVGKAAYAVGFAEQLKLVFPAGDDFMRIALVADVPEQFVLFEIEGVVQRQRQFHDAEVAGQMSTGLRDRAENKPAYFIGKGVQLLYGQLFEVRRAIDLLQ